MVARSALVAALRFLVARNTSAAPFTYTLPVTSQTSGGLDDPTAVGETPANGLRLRVTRCTADSAACPQVIYDVPVQIAAQTIGTPGVGQSAPSVSPCGSPRAAATHSSTLTLTWTATQTT
ncbi:MAG TPA: hypothetical protein VFX49_01545 [Chloroflexota bacterium]|nr:hypothetical protein [Chloroflexota bacterium]